MKGCMGCFGFLLLMSCVGMAIQAVAYVWINFWPPIVGLTLSWVALRYYKAIAPPRYEEID